MRSLLEDPNITVCVSVLTLYEVRTTFLYRTGSHDRADKAVTDLRLAVSAVLPVTEATLSLAFELRRASTARLAIADCLIAATAVQQGAILVHRDSHFAALPTGRLAQETLPEKASRATS